MTSSHPFSDEYFSFLDFEKNVTIDSRSLTIDTLSSSSLPSLSVTNKEKNTVTISFYQFSLIWNVPSLLAKSFQSMFMGSGVEWTENPWLAKMGRCQLSCIKLVKSDMFLNIITTPVWNFWYLWFFCLIIKLKK